KKAFDFPDPEVRFRVTNILKERARRQDLRMVERLKGLVKGGAVDQVAELLAQWPEGREEEACWAEIRTLAETLVNLRHDHGPPDLQDVKRNYGGLPKVVLSNGLTKLPSIEDAALVRACFLRGRDIRLDYGTSPLDWTTVACSGSFRTGS